MAENPTPKQTFIRYGILTAIGLGGYFGLSYAAEAAGMAQTTGLSIAIGLLVGCVLGVGGAMLGIIGNEPDEDDHPPR